MNRTTQAILLLLVATFAAQPVLAHHPLGGMPMETFGHGVLSGIGHPLLGFDHLFFILVAGVIARFSGYSMTAPLVLMGGVLGGVMLNVGGLQLPASEFLIALSLILLGGIGLYGKTLTLMPLIVFFGGLGLCHGWAFGQVIVQQEMVSQAVLSGYLLGLAAVQWLVAVGSGIAAVRLLGAVSATDVRARLACAVVTGVGVTFLLENLESVVFGL